MQILSLLLAAAVVVPAAGQSSSTAATQRPAAAETAVDVDLLGPKVGESVPDFSSPDQRGETRTLKSIVGPRGAVLVFFRSADW